ncbi:polysaccharide biosynthesis/export family protein [Sphingobacterium sp. lm-10]|uniref:polysaccharide biosynthesis/export family protein n=1 Tax=Sphingobacterium sp. lm-10 TaxID=2944904 RepID=UPI0020203CA1|nr:polysaccharide biosynthesis/export family protein [Sphingobacterium sp. lm-10]MCL7988425.1 polysaccharide biosynthesis/export family protein [Sphingobacterium sp. lm-10]
MKKYLVFTALISLLSLHSCIVSKKVVYVKDMQEGVAYPTIAAPPIRIQKNDRLSITVSAKNPELAAPFNLDIGNYGIDADGSQSIRAGQSNNTFLVDAEGKIDYPIIGTISIEGLTIDGVRDLIWENLVNKKLIAEPIVKVELINVKITMMGEVSNIGILDIPDTRITLLDALARSGGLTANAVPNKVSVIREENGVRKIYMNDIESTNLFNAPTFYLQQNDIVYAHPKGPVPSAREDNTLRYLGLATGFIGMIISILILIR